MLLHDQELAEIYNRLRHLAGALMAREVPDHTLQATALVNETYLRMTRSRSCHLWKDNAEFYRTATEVMRCVLIDSARRRNSLKRGGHLKKHSSTERDLPTDVAPADKIALLDAIERLGLESPVKAELVRLRFFEGFSHQAAAKHLGLSRATADRYWAYAKVWLYQDLCDDGESSSTE